MILKVISGSTVVVMSTIKNALNGVHISANVSNVGRLVKIENIQKEIEDYILKALRASENKIAVRQIFADEIFDHIEPVIKQNVNMRVNVIEITDLHKSAIKEVASQIIKKCLDDFGVRIFSYSLRIGAQFARYRLSNDVNEDEFFSYLQSRLKEYRINAIYHKYEK